MLLRSLLYAGAATALFLAEAPADAAVVFSARSIVATIHTTKSDFSDAVLTVDATTTVKDGSSGTRDLNFVPLYGLTSSTYTTTPGITLSNYTASGNTVSGTVTATGGGSFTFHNSYATGLDDPFADATLFRYTDGTTAFAAFTNQTLPLLEVYLGVGSGGLVDNGGTYTFSLVIPGNYSSTAGLDSVSGQHYEDYSVYDGFKVLQDYVFDPVANTTTLTLQNTSFEDEEFIGLDTYFVGGAAVAAVPEPATWLTTILGLGLAGALLRRRQGRDGWGQRASRVGGLRDPWRGVRR